MLADMLMNDQHVSLICLQIGISRQGLGGFIGRCKDVAIADGVVSRAMEHAQKRVISLRDAGMTLREIESETGWSVSKVQNFLTVPADENHKRKRQRRQTETQCRLPADWQILCVPWDMSHASRIVEICAGRS